MEGDRQWGVAVHAGPRKARPARRDLAIAADHRRVLAFNHQAPHERGGTAREQVRRLEAAVPLERAVVDEMRKALDAVCGRALWRHATEILGLTEDVLE